ncbi:MAG: rhodanese-like domain-containing protein [Cyanobacteria bacterium J06623_7]
MSLEKLASIAVSLLLLCTACQNLESLNDRERQVKIETMYRQYAKKFPQAPEITVAELQQLQERGTKFVVIDVRSPAEISVSRLPGAITPAEFETHLGLTKDAEKVVAIAYCTIGYRSGLYAQKLQEQGVRVLNLKGGVLAWSHGGGQLVDDAGSTKRVHVFGRQWRLAAEDYKPVW